MLDHLGHQAHRDLRVAPVLLGPMDLLDQQANLDQLDHWDLLVHWDH